MGCQKAEGGIKGLGKRYLQMKNSTTIYYCFSLFSSVAKRDDTTNYHCVHLWPKETVRLTIIVFMAQ